MERKGIKPRQNADQGQIRRALSLRRGNNQNQGQMRQPDQFFKSLESEMIRSLIQNKLPFNEQQIKSFIDSRGVPELKMELIVNGMTQPHNYQNSLYAAAPGAPEQAPGEFAYFDPAENPSADVVR